MRWNRAHAGRKRTAYGMCLDVSIAVAIVAERGQGAGYGILTDPAEERGVTYPTGLRALDPDRL